MSLVNSVKFQSFNVDGETASSSDLSSNFGQEKDVLKNLVGFVVRHLVDNPEKVSVSVINGEQATIIELKVSQLDLGKVIGKQGRTAKALRTLVHSIATKQKKRAILEILE